MMIPTMAEYGAGSGFLGTSLANFQKIQSKSKSFRIEDILDIREQQEHLYSAGSPSDCEADCYDNMRHDGKRIRGPRKDRTIFSKIQLFRLERRFHDQKYLSSYEKALIAHSLQLTQQQVQTWFQNRRAKAKREEREKKKQGGHKQDSSSLDDASFEEETVAPNVSVGAPPREEESGGAEVSNSPHTPLSADNRAGVWASSSITPPPLAPAPTSQLLPSPASLITTPLRSPSNNPISPNNTQMSPYNNKLSPSIGLISPSNPQLITYSQRTSPLIAPKASAFSSSSPPLMRLIRMSSPTPTTTLPFQSEPRGTIGRNQGGSFTQMNNRTNEPVKSSLHRFSIDSLTSSTKR